MLPPNCIDATAGILTTTLQGSAGLAATLSISEKRPGILKVTSDRKVGPTQSESLLMTCRRILRLDDDLTRFYRLAASDPEISWVVTGAGRMVRSPTVFEDVVKTICTTNCSWSGTERMVGALVRHLGASSPAGGHAFPTPAAMAEAELSFYRDEVRAGYRGAYLQSLARAVAHGEVDLEALNAPELPDDQAEARLLALPGVGPYATAHIMLTALGRNRLLILDSWTRPTFAQLSGRKPSDQAIRRRFRRFDDYQGLAFWLYLTRDWVAD